MNKIFEFNDKIGENISKYFKGITGIVINCLVLFLILSLIGLFIYWTINVFLFSLLWLIPAIILIGIVFLINYFIKKVIHLYK